MFWCITFVVELLIWLSKSQHVYLVLFLSWMFSIIILFVSFRAISKKELSIWARLWDILTTFITSLSSLILRDLEAHKRVIIRTRTEQVGARCKVEYTLTVRGQLLDNSTSLNSCANPTDLSLPPCWTICTKFENRKNKLQRRCRTCCLRFIITVIVLPHFGSPILIC